MTVLEAFLAPYAVVRRPYPVGVAKVGKAFKVVKNGIGVQGFLHNGIAYVDRALCLTKPEPLGPVSG